ncbi:hypothetical protein M569_06432 [Genlisea aurea]|uniref:HMA domain-containing protein n=1 Tax=Genlisea aurea TaxID=192259 RepID=S8DYL1_9LAMI|nr:hypothetical protein M569_06432 [Genlisea aurea]
MKIIIHVPHDRRRSRNDALKVISQASGVIELIEFKETGRIHLEVTGYGIDPIHLTSLIRKKFPTAELVGVDTVPSPDDDVVQHPQYPLPTAPPNPPYQQVHTPVAIGYPIPYQFHDPPRYSENRYPYGNYEITDYATSSFDPESFCNIQ